jgi:hypothetical protein
METDFPKQQFGLYVNDFWVGHEVPFLDVAHHVYKTVLLKAFKISLTTPASLKFLLTTPGCVQATDQDKN